MAYEAPTMPGSVATLATCSSDRSEATSGNNALDANTTPGTRIAPDRSIRNRYGDSSTSRTCCRSASAMTPVPPVAAADGAALWGYPTRRGVYQMSGLRMKGDRVEIVVDAGGRALTYEVTASRAGRRVETSMGRGVVEVAEVTRAGTVVRTARFMSSRVLALVEHPVPRRADGEVPG